jgi:hypothetical protein
VTKIDRSTDIRSALRHRQRGFILNPFVFGGNDGNPGEWSPTRKSSAFTLTSTNKLTTHPSGLGTGTYVTRGVTPRSTGKWYFEVTYTRVSGTVGNSCYVGIRRSTDSVGTDRNTGGRVFAAANNNTSLSATTGSTFPGTWGGGGALNVGESCTVGFAFDFDLQKCWLHLNGVWRNSGDPANSANNQVSSFGTGPWLHEVNVFDPADFSTSYRIRSLAADLLYPAPPGFSAWEGDSVGMLDAYTSGLVAAYGLNRLNSTYTGSCMRVRRSSDNTEQDIGFAGMAYDYSALDTFIGAGDGFVVTLYDQSGNGRNLTMATTSRQPRIATSGTIHQEIRWDGSDDVLQSSSFGITSSACLTVFCRGWYNSTSDGARLFDISSGGAGVLWQNSIGRQTQNGFAYNVPKITTPSNTAANVYVYDSTQASGPAALTHYQGTVVVAATGTNTGTYTPASYTSLQITLGEYTQYPTIPRPAALYMRNFVVYATSAAQSSGTRDAIATKLHAG